jgi:hypothetical protein
MVPCADIDVDGDHDPVDDRGVASRSRRVALKLTDTDPHRKPAALEVTYTWR